MPEVAIWLRRSPHVPLQLPSQDLQGQLLREFALYLDLAVQQSVVRQPRYVYTNPPAARRFVTCLSILNWKLHRQKSFMLLAACVPSFPVLGSISAEVVLCDGKDLQASGAGALLELRYRGNSAYQ